MPCRCDGYDDINPVETLRAEVARLEKVKVKFEAAFNKLVDLGPEVFQARDCDDLYNEALKRVELKKRDAERSRKAQEEKERKAALKEAALAKLTKAERKALGL